jgi:hypothetical protein
VPRIIALYERLSKAKTEHHRDRAAQLREMAAPAPANGDLKDKLLDHASQYDRLVERVLR